MELNDILKFLGRDVWNFVFGKYIGKLQTNRKGKHFNEKGTYLIDCEDIKFHHFLIKEKTPSLNETLALDNILYLVSGLIKGVLACFNIDASVQPSFKPQTALNNIFKKADVNQEDSSGYAYSFTITLPNASL